ncbi:helix-turn-helix domain-containing protein [Pseudonocardia cypriaca]|uniref:XRE family transcriptional regulator n=1 Tax=Pseudonocardia cypriaca TaxID=882449 RepID=A0A543GA50_9PSEU|nr:XRE family transcriptional regulator [Pseudonocardia cypriaca]TQM42970.1 XRE family transcriptional regulator [Pseudonocardia cypriaca]
MPVPASPRPDGRRLGARIRLLREERGWSLRRAEEVTGVSRAMLSKIELGTAAPTVPVLGRIAEGFGVSISQLVGGRPAATPSENVVVLPAAEQPVFRVPGTGFERRSLAPRIAGAVDLAVNHLPPGQSSDTFPAHRPGVQEVLTVAAGRLHLVLDDDRYELGHGDSIYFRADHAHRFDNPSDTEAAVFYIVVVDVDALA